MHKRSPIYHSVGANAANLATDVATVQHLLNASGAASLPIDGRAGPITIAAIEKVQRRYLHMQTPDGRVDPNGETIHFLIAAHPPAAVPHPTAAQSFTSTFSQNLASAYHSLETSFSHLISQYVTPHGAPLTSGSVQAKPAQTVAPPSGADIAWGAKVASDFKAKVIKICGDLKLDPNFLMACMALETVEKFSPSIKNPGSSATGLIQFMADTAKGLGTTTAALAKMSAVDQLDYVYKYFKPYTGKLKTVEDTYMVIFCPRGVGKENSYALYESPSESYNRNIGFDPAPRTGKITKGQAGAGVAAKLKKGLKQGYKG